MVFTSYVGSISIHALREEGDLPLELALTLICDFYPRPPRGGRPVFHLPTLCRSYFYPRPPRGGRPANSWDTLRLVTISIHALREEGDLCLNTLMTTSTNFYPRPPRGGRRPKIGDDAIPDIISIHALREEGDIRL